jgi:hypothetical protein
MDTNKHEFRRAGECNRFTVLWAAIMVLACATAMAQTNHYLRASVAEVKSVRLEVEQPLYQTELRIRVSDYSAQARQMTNVACDLFYVDENGKESKLGSVKLKQELPASNNYSGSYSSEHEFTHGTVAKVSYQSPGLRLPISTWYILTFH